METNQSQPTPPSTTDQPCPTCIKYHDEVKKSFVQLDQKMNLILTKMDEIISSTITPAPKEESIGGSEKPPGLSSSKIVMNGEDSGMDLVNPMKKKLTNGNFNNSINNTSNSSNGVRKRKQQTTPQNGTTTTVSKMPKQELIDHESSSNNIFNSSMPILTEQQNTLSPLSNQQLLDHLTLATVLGGSEGNNEVLNAFFQSGLLQNDPQLLMNVLNASIQDIGGGFLPDSTTTATLTTANTRKRSSSSRKPSSKQQSAAASPPSTITATSPFMSNVKTEDLNEEQLREALAISAEAASSNQCSNCYATKTSAWRRNQDGQLICNACGLYYRMHQTNRPMHLKKNHIQTRYRRKNGGESSASSSPMLLSMDDENIINNDLSFNNSNNFEMLFGTTTTAAAMAK